MATRESVTAGNETNISTVTMKGFRSALSRALKYGKNLLVLGTMGIGKTAMVHDLAPVFQYARVIEIIGSLLEPVDLRGFPKVIEAAVAKGEARAAYVTVFAPLNLLPTGKEKVVLFLDELGNASDEVMRALQSLILTRRLLDYVLPENVTIIAASNRVQDKTQARNILSALYTRFSGGVYDYTPTAQEWLDAWGLKNLRPSVAQYIRKNPDMFLTWDGKKKTYACPRTWDMLSQMLNAEGASDPEDIRDMACGIIGVAEGVQYAAWEKLWQSIGDTDAALKTPETAAIPTELDTLWAWVGIVSRKVNAGTMDAAVVLSKRLKAATLGGMSAASFGFMLVNDAVSRDANLMSTKGYGEWALMYADQLVASQSTRH